MTATASNGQRIFFGVVALFFLVGVTVYVTQKREPIEPPTPAQEYPGAWRNSSHPTLMTTLAKNHVTGCGELVWRESVQHRGQLLVYCTRDGTQWLAYLAWPAIGEVTGPLDTPADIDPPN